jgi:hypothetical protein
MYNYSNKYASIDVQLENAKSSLKRLQEKREELISSILERVYSIKWNNLDSIKDTDKFLGALHYFFQKEANSFSNLYSITNSLRYKGQIGKTYVLHLTEFRDSYGTGHGALVGFIKDISEVIDWHKFWQHMVNDGNITMSLSEFKVEMLKPENEKEFMVGLKSFYGRQLNIINCPELAIENIFVLLPEIALKG